MEKDIWNFLFLPNRPHFVDEPPDRSPLVKKHLAPQQSAKLERRGSTPLGANKEKEKKRTKQKDKDFHQSWWDQEARNTNMEYGEMAIATWISTG